MNIMAVEKSIRLDTSQIGEGDKRNLAATFYDAMKRFYADPTRIREFERWQKEQRKSKNGTKRQKGG